jgi:hypothetical protein
MLQFKFYLTGGIDGHFVGVATENNGWETVPNCWQDPFILCWKS